MDLYIKAYRNNSFLLQNRFRIMILKLLLLKIKNNNKHLYPTQIQMTISKEYYFLSSRLYVHLDRIIMYCYSKIRIFFHYLI